VPSRQLVLPLETRPALGREVFIVAPANRDAVALIDSFPGWPAPAVAIHGPAGSGKSHLAAVWASRAGAVVADAARLGDDLLLGDPRAVAIENVDGAAPDAARDAVIFALLERGHAVLLTGRARPEHWPAVLPDLPSRYGALLSFRLWEPDDALLAALARKLFADRQLAVPDAVVAQMLRTLERSPSAIRDFVARADSRALAEKRPVSAALVREILEE
jgi:chromosomal replication initiation ATPase DnaA